MIESLLERITSSEADTRAEGFAGLQGLDCGSCSESQREAIGAALKSLIESKEYSDPERQTAASLLGTFGRERILLELLGSETPSIRGQAAVGLGECGTPSACLALVRTLADPVNTVRNLAERSLIKQLDLVRSHCVEDLLGLLEHPEPLTHSPAARLLGLAGDPAALEPLLRMADGGEKWLTRVWAVKALGDLGQLSAFEALCVILREDEKNRVRAAAAAAIAELRHPESKSVLESITSETDDGVTTAIEEALELLQQSGEAEAADPFADG
jgi:HEAT repeat protein